LSNGFFITFEGGEGCGKSTQARLLSDELNAQGYNTTLTREPGGVSSSEKIREILVEGDKNSLYPMTELLLLFAARFEHIERKIKPELNKGNIVICDRFYDSSIAYQGYGHGIELSKIEQLKKVSIDSFHPDLTFLLDLPVLEGLSRSRRIENRELRFENMDVSFHEKVHNGFNQIAKNNPSRFTIIDASQPIEKIKKYILDIVSEKINIHKEL